MKKLISTALMIAVFAAMAYCQNASHEGGDNVKEKVWSLNYNGGKK